MTLHAGRGGFIDGGRRSFAVFSDDDQTLDALGDHIVDLVVLQFDVVVGFLHQNVVTLVIEQLGQQLGFGLPALGRKVGEG